MWSEEPPSTVLGVPPSPHLAVLSCWLGADWLSHSHGLSSESMGHGGPGLGPGTARWITLVDVTTYRVCVSAVFRLDRIAGVIAHAGLHEACAMLGCLQRFS